MGLLTGTAGRVSTDKALAQLENFLVTSEEILLAFKIGRDVHAFTNFRLLSLDVKGMTGAKRALRSIAWGRVTAFSVESAGAFDADAELRLWVPGLELVEIKLDADTPIAEVQRVLAVMTLRGGDV